MVLCGTWSETSVAQSQLTQFWQIPRHCERHFSSRLPRSGETWKYAKAPSTKKTWWDSLPIDMLLSAVSVLVVSQSSSEIPEGLMNNPVLFCLLPVWLHTNKLKFPPWHLLTMESTVSVSPLFSHYNLFLLWYFYQHNFLLPLALPVSSSTT